MCRTILKNSLKTPLSFVVLQDSNERFDLQVKIMRRCDPFWLVDSISRRLIERAYIIPKRLRCSILINQFE